MSTFQLLGRRFARSRGRRRRAQFPTHARQIRLEQLEDRLVMDCQCVEMLDFYSVQVNPESQQNNYEAAVDIAPNGDFTVAWRNAANGENHIYSRVYGPTLSPKQGQPVKLTAQTAGYTSQFNWQPDVAVNDSGKSAVVWTGSVPEGDDSYEAVFFQRMTANGTPIDSPEEAWPGEEDYFDPKVAMADSGDFVIAWTSHDVDELQGGTPGHKDVFCRFFREDGTPYQDFTDVATVTDLSEMVDGVAINSVSSGEHSAVVVWRERDFPGVATGNDQIHFRMYSLNDEGVEEVDIPGTPWQADGWDASVAMDEDGSFVIAWLDEGGVFAQRFNKEGVTVGSSILLVDGDPTLFNSQTNIDVSIFGSQVVVAYEQDVSNSYGDKSFVGQFQLAGGSANPVVHRSLGTTRSYSRAAPSVAMNASGEYVVTYIRDSDNSVRARKFNPDGSSVLYFPMFYPAFPTLLPHLWGANFGGASATIRPLTPNVSPIYVGSLEATDSAFATLAIDGTDTAVPRQSLNLLDSLTDPASGDADTFAFDCDDSALDGLNDESLVAIAQQWTRPLTEASR